MPLLRQFFSLFFLMMLLSGCKIEMLDPQGWVALQEKHLLITSVLLMLIVVIPVLILTVVFAWRYRSQNTRAVYAPDWAHSTLLEIIWWTIPLIIIALLATLTWKSTHRLDPFKPLENVSGRPLTVQAIALDWKWLFIYPEQRIATVNFAQIPVNTPIKFIITADAPMNSFQIPQLAGQIYAMPGMASQLYLLANHNGDYRGMSANYSGNGFSGMTFTIRVSSPETFQTWVNTLKKTAQPLTFEGYEKLAQPSQNEPVSFFVLKNPDLFETVIMKYMMPQHAVH